jgi:amino acid adenylation domain-containing protein
MHEPAKNDASKLALLAQDKFNQTESHFPFVPVSRRIHQQAQRNPNKTAVIYHPNQRMTYGELETQTNSVANFLQKKLAGEKRKQEGNPCRDTIVGVLLERSVWAYIAEQGILKAGAAFLPFVTSYPDERICFCLEDAGAPLLITSAGIKAARPDLAEKAEVVTMEEILSSADTSPLSTAIGPHDLAYVIYTSGSTGKPKGVMIEQHSFANYMERDEKSIEIMHFVQEGRVALAMAAFSFDVSIVEEFVPLANGCTVCIATEDEIHDPFLLSKLIQSAGVNGMTCTPTFLLSILNIPECREALRQVTFYDVGAEPFPAGLFTRLRELRPDSIIMNVYGPTECTMGCSSALMEAEGEIVVGGPMVNTKFYVVNEQGDFLPLEEKGELIICGACVGRGYINLPERTAKAFFTCNGHRAYHSGDLASWTKDGRIRIHGRIDNQIKLRGFRIELDEIEKVMGEYPAIDSCAVKVLQRAGQSDYLAGYFTASAAEALPIEEILAFMKARLPEYMIPTAMVQLDAMPQTVNGKINRQELPRIEPAQGESRYVPPRNDSESYICQVFAEVLHLPPDTVGIEDDFFQLGGDSLSSMVLVSKLMDKGIASADVFSLRTVERLAALLAERGAGESLDEREDKERKKPHKLSPMQIEMVDNQFAKFQSTMFNNMSYFFRFARKTDPDKLQRAVNAAIGNHPALAMKISFNDSGELVQTYAPEIIREVQYEYLSDLEIIELSKDLIRPFNIFREPLVRVRLFKSSRYIYMFFDVHHLAMDGSSLSILLTDIIRAYRGEALPRDYYCTYLAKEEKLRASPQYQEDKAYFLSTYGGYDWCNIPEPDKDNEAELHLEADSRQIKLPFDEADLAAAEKRLHTSRSVLAIAAAIQALYEFSGQKHIMTNWIFNNRLGGYAANSVGMLIKNLPVGVHMEQIDSVETLLAEVKKQVTEGITHSNYDYFVANDSPYQNDPMEVNYQLNINADELDELQPFYLPLPNKYHAPGARLELEFLENDDNSGYFESEFEWAGNIFSRNRIVKFHNLYMETFVRFVLG